MNRITSPHMFLLFLFHSFEFMMKHIFLTPPYYYLSFIAIYIYIIILNVRLIVKDVNKLLAILVNPKHTRAIMMLGPSYQNFAINHIIKINQIINI